MKTRQQVINELKDDFESALHYYLLSEMDIEKKMHYAEYCTYERVLKKLGITQQEVNEIVNKARSAFQEMQQLPFFNPISIAKHQE